MKLWARVWCLVFLTHGVKAEKKKLWDCEWISKCADRIWCMSWSEDTCKIHAVYPAVCRNVI